MANLPVLFGVMGVFFAVFGAFGPSMYGYAYDIYKSYNFAFIVTGVLCVLSGVCLMLLKKPTKAKAAATVGEATAG
jgi:cyanate permease